MKTNRITGTVHEDQQNNRYRTVHEDQYTFLTRSRSVLPTMRNLSRKYCRENYNTHFMFKSFLFFRNRAIYEVTWKNTVEPKMPQLTIRNMRIACWIAAATDTHPEYVILISFHCKNGYENAPPSYTIRALPALLFLDI